MKTIKRILAFALCLTLLGSLLAVTGTAQDDAAAWDAPFMPAFAQKVHDAFADLSGQDGEPTVNAQADVQFRYVVIGVQATIIGATDIPASLRIPETIDGYTVAAIGDQAFYRANIREVYLPKSLRTIGYAAFAGCSNLKRVVLPDGLLEIGKEAFYNCGNLETVATGIYRDNDVTDVSVYMPRDLETLGDRAFSGCRSLNGMVFRQGLTEISDYAFSGCKNMDVFVTYADTIGKQAFYKTSTNMLMLLSLLRRVNHSAFEEAQAITVIYCGSTKQFTRFVDSKGLDIRGSLYALGAELRYKSTGRIADALDPTVVSLIEKQSYIDAFFSADPEILEIQSDRQSYKAVGVGTVQLRHPFYEMINEYCDPEAKYPEAPAYVTVSYAWWQQLIRILLFGWIWY
ncbi:MAG: leucine-rich repeat domain-containing protein [Clostridia bacterium]|nr:leucine-rich repeat domain-containing protein [Clostridia bacterium]